MYTHAASVIRALAQLQRARHHILCVCGVHTRISLACHHSENCPKSFRGVDSRDYSPNGMRDVAVSVFCWLG